MKNKPTFLALIFLVLSFTSVINAQNTALQFDGDGDFIRAQLSPPLGDQDFTMETWFFSDLDSTNSCTNWNCLDHFRRIIALSGPDHFNRTSRYEIGTCQGLLSILYRLDSTSCTTYMIQPQGGLCVRDGEWHHLAFVKEGEDITAYLDCMEVWNNDTHCPNRGANITSFSVGNWGGPPSVDQIWNGQIDETRLWDRALTDMEIKEVKLCRPDPEDPTLLLWYDYEEGEIEDDNTAIIAVKDISFNSNDATIFNMALNGQVSNYVESTLENNVGIFEGLYIEVRAYPQGPAIQEICDGDPVHISAYIDGISPPSGGQLGMVEWEMDKGNGWLPVSSPPFLGWNFPLPQGYLNADCQANSLGYKDVRIRAKAMSSVINPVTNYECEFITPAYDLRICCPITSASIDIVPDTPICAGEIQNFDISLISNDLFVQQLADAVSIKWLYTLSNKTVTLYADSNKLSFSQVVDLTQITASTSLCFEAEVQNCNKTKIFKKCIQVDPPPVCGTLTAAAPEMMLITSSPHKIYELCPFNDAILKFSGEMNCKKRWQYRFDGGPWTDEGSVSNPQLNTNTLEWDFFWQMGEEKIFYRVICDPEKPNSGCPSLVCDSIEIRLIPTPNIPVISSSVNLLCDDDFPHTISVSNPLGQGTYEWYQDGIFVGTGTSWTIDEAGCFKVKWLGPCDSLLSEKVCLEQCKIAAIISCPVNDTCVCIGETIVLNALECTSSCDQSMFTYSWTIDGNPGGSSDHITHTPQTSGSTYHLTVTDVVSGCSDTSVRTIIPCNK